MFKYAYSCSNLLDVAVRKLLNGGVNPDSSNADGLTALHQVCSLSSSNLFYYCILRSSLPAACEVLPRSSCLYACTLTQPRWGGAGAPPEIGFIRKFLAAPLSKYIKLCMVWQPNILNNCYELSGGYAPSEPPTRGSAPGPRWGTSVPPPPNPGYASVYLNKKLCALRRTA